MPESGLRDPLRRPIFRRLAISYAVNELGDWMGIVALSVLVFEQTGSALATTALFLGMGFLPALFTPLLTARVERGRARYVLPAIYCGEAIAFGALALSVSNFSLPVVVVLATLDGSLALTARALTRSVTATLLAPAGELRAGNAILNVAFTGGAAVGPALAGVVVAAFGARSALLLDAASFYAIAWLLLTAGRVPQAATEAGGMLQRVRAGLNYIRSRVVLKGLLIAQAIALIFFSAVLPVEVIYVKETLDGGDSGYGLLLASWGTGMVIGSIAFAILRGARLGFLLLVSTLVIGIAYLGMAAAPTLGAACAMAALGGTGNGIQWVSVVSAAQELTSESMQARVMSVLEASASATPGIGFVVGGLIASQFDPRATFLVAGAGVVVVALAAGVFLGAKWEALSTNGPEHLDAADEVMVHLSPRATRQTKIRAETGPRTEGASSQEESR